MLKLFALLVLVGCSGALDRAPATRQIDRAVAALGQGFVSDTTNMNGTTHFANAYSAPAQLRAAFEMYRALTDNEKFSAAQRNTIDLPIVLAGGDHACGKGMPGTAEELRARGCASATTELIENGGHYLADEQPDAVAALVERYASQ
jgi:pimeloyl-ACP methyl ester carboxylesterase